MSARNQDFKKLLVQGTKKLQKGRAQEAIPYLQQAHKLRPEDLDAAINLSGAFILTKRFQKAVSVLEPLSTKHPDQAMIWINLGAAYLGNPVLARDEDQRRAISAFEQALEIDPAAYSVAYNIGLIYRDRQEVKEAIDWLNQAIDHNPDDKDAHRLLKSLKQHSLACNMKE